MKEIKFKLEKITEATEADKTKTTFLFIPVLDSLQKELKLTVSTESADLTMDDLGLPVEIGDEITFKIGVVNSQQKLDDSALLAGVKSRKDLETHASKIGDGSLHLDAMDEEFEAKPVKKRGRPRKKDGY